MLSRIAESLYWIGRYVERAEDTARILDVQFHRLLEDPWIDEDAACRALLAVMGTPAGDDDLLGALQVCELLAYDRASPSSIVGAMTAARDNARGAREAIPSEMWECLNATWYALGDETRMARALGPHGFFRYIKERAAILAGLADSTLSRDDGWRFLVLGRSLERVDMTARLLSARWGDAAGSPGWVTTLRCCSAHEGYLRTYRRAVDASLVAEFLLLDRLFPRSVFHALSTAEGCLADLDPLMGRVGLEDEARRILGRARTELEFQQTSELFRDLPRHLAAVQAACSEAAVELSQRYFHQTAPIEWTRDVSWRIAIDHVTRHRYAGDVFGSYNEARVTPLTLPRQICMEANLDVTPAARTYRYWDYWGSAVTVFDIHTPHDELVVHSTATVETSPMPAIAPATTWAELASPDLVDGFAEYLAPTRYVPSTVEQIVEDLRGAPTPDAAARGAVDWVRGRLRYQPGATDVQTSAVEALQQGEGVCQDFAHLTLAVLRTLGIPARYVSGYLHPSPDAVVGESVTGQSHAWVEWWCGDWLAWDPTHGVPVGERHVLVARGRDYADVTPLKGVYHGAAALTHDVLVQLTRTA